LDPQADQAVLRDLLAELAAMAEDVPQLREDETRSAGDLLTVACLNAAFWRGGLEAVERQCEMAARRRDMRPERISVRELIWELDL
jgi:hypothetical protein